MLHVFERLIGVWRVLAKAVTRFELVVVGTKPRLVDCRSPTGSVEHLDNDILFHTRWISTKAGTVKGIAFPTTITFSNVCYEKQIVSLETIFMPLCRTYLVVPHCDRFTSSFFLVYCFRHIST